MLVCHKYKFIFFKTQKTASTSIEIALSSLCTEEDIITPISKNDEKVRQALGYLGPRNYKVPLKKYSKDDVIDFIFKGKRRELYNHISCEELMTVIGDKVFKDYYKFCFERNPYEKALSLFFHEGGYEKWTSLKNFIEQGGLKVIKGYDQYTVNNVVAVDDVFKYENIPTALDVIAKKINLQQKIELPKTKLKSQFRKDKRPYDEVLSQEEKDLIATIWAREIKLMGY
ncbi:sulfotransferase family 2 domain-containing protein [Winogradskyella algicola]|uniref:sulfotransferase family 2 domain-containing protein n=1 Tax=Winogradskyella algicola TaxID=2575815 RepID=UPI00110881F0|nr:sulfotransferase family 2 domain-containing protein [Winogradskyella algicola]